MVARRSENEDSMENRRRTGHSAFSGAPRLRIESWAPISLEMYGIVVSEQKLKSKLKLPRGAEVSNSKARGGDLAEIGSS
jgi:hypothetical protein